MLFWKRNKEPRLSELSSHLFLPLNRRRRFSDCVIPQKRDTLQCQFVSKNIKIKCLHFTFGSFHHFSPGIFANNQHVLSREKAGIAFSCSSSIGSSSQSSRKRSCKLTKVSKQTSLSVLFTTNSQILTKQWPKIINPSS